MKNEKLTADIISRLVESKCSDPNLSWTYKRDLKVHSKRLLSFLEERNVSHLEGIEFNRIEAQVFLDQFNSSATYYNNTKRSLGAIFQYGVERGVLVSNPFKAIALKRAVEKKHEALSLEKLMALFEFIDEVGRFSALRICMNLVYSTFLRPHEEIRLLRRGDFSEDLSRLMITGDRTKSRRNRTVFLDIETARLLEERGVKQLEPSINIWSMKTEPFGPSYFNNQWRKLRELDKRRAESKFYNHERLIGPRQSLYSIRHNAAIAHYRKNQDIGALQREMDHRSVQTTEKYLRDLGLVTRVATKVPDKYEVYRDYMATRQGQ